MTTIASRFSPPKPIRRQWRHLRRHARHSWERYLKWPAPLWRARGYARLAMEGHEFTFRIENVTVLWARRVWRGKWERNGTSFLAQVLRPGDVFMDVGAWAGPYSILAARLVGPGGHVYSFEPDPVARAILEKNVDGNQLSNVTVLPYGVTDQHGVSWLASPRLGDSQSKVDAAGGVVQIETVSLARFCQERKISPAVIKIDVEGGEAAVFDGAGDFLRKARGIVLEVHDPQLRSAGFDPVAFRRTVDELGKRATVLHERPDAGNTLLGLLDPSAGVEFQLRPRSRAAPKG